MATRRPVTIYRFDSPCGEYCYVGRTKKKLEARIRDHGNATGDSAICRHCRECDECDEERRNENRWKNYFRKIDDAIRDNQANDLEQHYIDKYCDAYILNFRKPFPLNLRAEAGNGFTQRAARNIYMLRAELAEEKSRTDQLQANLDVVARKQDSLRQERDNLQEDQNRLKRESDTLKAERDGARQQQDKFRKERDTARKQRSGAVLEQQRLRKQNDALTTQLNRGQEGHRALEERLEDLEEERVKLRNQNDALTRNHDQAQEQYHAALDQLASLEREHERHTRLVKRLERRARGYDLDRKRLERKSGDAVARHKRENRRRNRIIVVLAIVAASLFFAITNPDVLERGPAFLSFLSQDDSAPATVPFSSHTITATQQPTRTPTTTRIPSPTNTPFPTNTPQPPTATPRPTSTAQSILSPPQWTGVVTAPSGAIARACPRRDCEEITRLPLNAQAVVLGEARGSVVNNSTLWYRVALPGSDDDAFVHSSLLGSPTPEAPGS